MSSIKKSILIASILLLIITLAIPALSKSRYRRGTTYRSNIIEISGIESKTLEKDKSGPIYYSFKANVRNKMKRAIKVTVCFQAVDRRGYELKDICFYDKYIKRSSSKIFSDKRVIEAEEYSSIYKWQIEKLKIK